jgi:hypothetical protein
MTSARCAWLFIGPIQRRYGDGLAADRLTAGVGRRPPGIACEREGIHPGARCARRTAPQDAEDGGREGLPIRRARGAASLLDLFGGRRQPIVYRFFFQRDVDGWPDGGCPRCSMLADQVGHLAHLNTRDTCATRSESALVGG